MDKISQQQRSKIMKKIRGKDTRLEETFRKALWRHGIRYRKNVATLPGKPDLYLPKKKLVVFLDSCFWHGCAAHCRMPASNIDYWKNKIDKNKKRDEYISTYYKNIGFNIIRIWEHELKESFSESLSKIINILKLDM